MNKRQSEGYNNDHEEIKGVIIIMQNVINNVQKSNQPQQFNRGDIYLATVENNVGGSVQNICQRPMIIISNHMSLLYSPVIHAIPLSSKVFKKWIPTHVSVPMASSGLLKDSVALCEQVMLLPKEGFSKKIGVCSDMIISKLEEGLMVQFGLFNHNQNVRNNVAYAN